MDANKIGAAAGVVWETLRENACKGCTLSELRKKTDGFTADEVVAGIGWLAREDKIHFEGIGRKTVLTLVGQELSSN